MKSNNSAIIRVSQDKPSQPVTVSITSSGPLDLVLNLDLDNPQDFRVIDQQREQYAGEPMPF